MKVRVKLFYGSRNIGGKIGIGLRYSLLKAIAYRCGDNVAVFQGAYILNPQNLTLGNNVSIHPMTYLECGFLPGGITIDDDVSIAHGATIMATSHNYQDGEIIKDNGVTTKPVHIHSNVWIAAKATITAGRVIASG